MNRSILYLIIGIPERKKTENEKDKLFSEWMKNMNPQFQEVYDPSKINKKIPH